MRIVTLFLISLSVAAQELSVEEAEALFLKNNYELLAQQFEQESANGLVRQQKIWDNPSLNVEEALNPIWEKEVANTNASLSQLFVIAKRSKRVQMSQIDANISKLTFDDTLRSLKLELRRTCYTLYYLNQNRVFYAQSIDALQKTVASAEHIFASRSILLAELIRLKSLLLDLESENLKLNKEIAEQESQLLVLLGEDPTSPARVLAKPSLERAPLASLNDILDIAAEHRPDLKISQALVKQEKINLSLQKLSWVPDLTLAANYQQQGNYVNNYVGLSLTLDLPIWDRAQGSIYQSRYALLAKQKREEQTRLSLLAQVKTAYNKTVYAETVFKRIDPSYLTHYDELAKNMIQNYRQGNIGIIAFTDFFESYRNSMIKMNEVQLNRLIAFEELNYAIGI